MTAYRFCRTDDRALLIDAHEACRGPEHAGEPALDVPEFKRLVRELDLWCSSCLVAFEGRQPVGVLLGCKRADATLVHSLRVHPEHRRKGHGRHLLTSLSQKLAILGPPRLVAEVPADSQAARSTFEACGWELETRLRDWRRPAGAPGLAAPPEARESLVPVNFQELGGTSLESVGCRAWARDVPALAKLSERSQGLAFHSPDRIEAWALFLPPAEAGGARELLALGAEAGALGQVGLAAVVGELARLFAGRDLFLPRASPEEGIALQLPELGFEPGAEHLLFSRRAQAA